MPIINIKNKSFIILKLTVIYLYLINASAAEKQK